MSKMLYKIKNYFITQFYQWTVIDHNTFWYQWQATLENKTAKQRLRIIQSVKTTKQAIPLLSVILKNYPELLDHMPFIKITPKNYYNIADAFNCQNKIPELVNLLKANNLNIDYQGINGGTALIFATSRGVFDSVAALLKYEPDLTLQDGVGTALYYAENCPQCLDGTIAELLREHEKILNIKQEKKINC